MLKNKALDIYDAWVLGALLYGTDDDRKYCAGLILAHPQSTADRFSPSNLMTASLHYPPAFLQTHGDTLVKMPWPLLPNDKRLQAMNQQNLAQTAAACGAVGGGSEKTCFRDAEAQGGGALQIHNLDHGTFLDTTPLEAALTTISNQVKALSEMRPTRQNFNNNNSNNYSNNRSGSNGNSFNNNRGRNNNNGNGNNNNHNNNNNNNNRRARGGDAPAENPALDF